MLFHKLQRLTQNFLFFSHGATHRFPPTRHKTRRFNAENDQKKNTRVSEPSTIPTCEVQKRGMRY